MIQLVCCYKPLHMEELYLMSADTVGKYVLYVNTHHCLRATASAERSGRSGKTKLQAHGSKLVCLLTRCKALQQSISDYKHGARAYVSAESEERRKNRARVQEDGKGERRGRGEAAGVKKGENEEAD